MTYVKDEMFYRENEKMSIHIGGKEKSKDYQLYLKKKNNKLFYFLFKEKNGKFKRVKNVMITWQGLIPLYQIIKYEKENKD